jgi:hypothetical protein
VYIYIHTSVDISVGQVDSYMIDGVTLFTRPDQPCHTST